jgi:hypothetical protein
MEHHPDNSKSRDQYLDMLEMAHKESPTDSRMLYYYGRELYFKGCFEDATKIFNEYLKYSTFIEEKSSAYRILSKCDPDNAESHLVNAIDTFRCRESVIDLADYYRVTSQWEKCIDKANEGLDIVDDINTFRSEREAWGHLPYDLLALSSWNLELWEDSYNYGLTAVDKCNNENDRQRLENNLSFYAERKNTWQQRSENLQTK